jgi:hypothetical protein
MLVSESTQRAIGRRREVQEPGIRDHSVARAPSEIKLNTSELGYDAIMAKLHEKRGRRVNLPATCAISTGGLVPAGYPESWPSPGEPELLPPGTTPFTPAILETIRKRKAISKTEAGGFWP